MPKAILEFTWETHDIDSKYDFNCAINGHEYRAVIEKVLEDMRAFVKYNTAASDEAIEAVEKMRGVIYDEIRERNLDVS
jgi:hypothetical protein